ncbi:triphosphoribosyl-dephospho-CoA synthase CitG [Clostridium sediminicola]|uniref:triphosphoribosyl-dephospho-CoA synthase CitG n=1 Tax=Clostridium sediminicola TaxID=3114879 RepID=UPI0031F26B99
MELYDNISEYISFLAQKAVLYEVSASPKPGLVDRYNSGAHNDMDYFTFLRSSSAIISEFKSMAAVGTLIEDKQLKDVLEMIRPIGIKAEKKMFQATSGVNTHKGIIFSIGVICVAAGFAMKKTGDHIIKAEVICDIVKRITSGICERELTNIEDKVQLSNGEKLYKKYELKGIRGEVESGFETVMTKGLPILRKDIEKGNLNDILVQALLNIMTVSEDTNIVWRHDKYTLNYVKEYSKIVLENGGMFSDKGKRNVIDMDKAFIEKNISPGGSADLLAVTIMLALLEGMNL